MLAFVKSTGIRVAEVGFLLLLIAGIWMVAAQLQARWAKMRATVAGILIAAAGVLLIVAVHWGHFGGS